MKNTTKTVFALLLSLAMSVSAFAGPVDALQLGDPAIIGEPDQTELFVSVKPLYMFSNDTHDAEYGVEGNVGFYFTELIGAQLTGGVILQDSEMQYYTVDVLARATAFDTLTPYVLAGGGLYTNSETAPLIRIGAGLGVTPIDGFTLYVEGVHNFVFEEVEDFTTVGAGIRFSF
jgi:hypothetical protein